VHESIVTCFVRLSEVKTELEHSQMAWEQDATALNQARDAQRKSEAIGQKVIRDIAKLGRAMSTVMAGLSVTLGPMTPETLIEKVWCLLGVVRELELTTARQAVHRVLAMFESHYQGLDRMVLSGGWAPGISDEQCDELEEDCAPFTRDMADVALKDLELLHRMHQRTQKPLGPQVNCTIICFM
jgi:hypothetical protein